MLITGIAKKSPQRLENGESLEYKDRCAPTLIALGNVAYCLGLGLTAAGSALIVKTAACPEHESSCLNQRVAGIAMTVIGAVGVTMFCPCVWLTIGLACGIASVRSFMKAMPQ